MKIFLAVLFCFLGGCTGSQQAEEFILADFDFANPRPDFAFGRVFGANQGLHWFRTGWAPSPDKLGVWAVGPASEIQLQLVGRNCRVTLTASTSGDLARAGQTVVLAINGRDLSSLDLPRGDRAFLMETTVPDSLLGQGPDILTLTPTRHRPAGDPAGGGETRPLSFMLRTLQVTATLDRDQAEAWQALASGPIDPAAWQPVTVPERNRKPQAQDPNQKPDLLIFLLDAARPDHFGCYGYGRDTTPAIDGLAADGIVFENVVSTASYTLCAVPSLLTGRSWIEHGMVSQPGNGQTAEALADSFITLPELLSSVGYQTLGYSSNPCFSNATNTRQGFDEFTEVWNSGDGRGNTPEVMSGLFDQRLAGGLAGNPTLCYFHLLPPHEPYFPGPEHDLWPVPDHDQWVDGSRASIQRLDRSRCDFREPDRDRLAALYDGNLHRVDAVVAHMVAAWRDLGRDRPFLIIVLSDHGEGFGEHCRFGHNKVVYDEMTRIPLIMSPRSACEALAPVRSRFLAITDVMPMLLNLTGIDPPPDSRWPRRFLQVAADPVAVRSAVLVRAMRGADHVGLRTDRYLALWDGWSRQELFDLKGDPGATLNLRRAENDLYLGLMGSLNSILEKSLGRGIAEKADLSEQDLKTLKSLGYL